MRDDAEERAGAAVDLSVTPRPAYGLHNHERNGIQCAKPLDKLLIIQTFAIDSCLAKVGVEGSNPFARSN